MYRLLVPLGCGLALAGFADEAPPPDQAPPKTHIVITRPEPGDELATGFIPLRDLAFADLEPLIRPLLSADGRLGYLDSRHTLIVHDRQRIIDQIEELVASLDRDVVNIRLKVEFTHDYLREGSRVGVRFDGRRRPPSITIEDGQVRGPHRVDIEVEDSKREVTEDVTQMLLTRSGSPAEIWVGKTIADPGWLRSYQFLPMTVIVAPGGIAVVKPLAPPVQWRDVGASLYVEPHLQDNGLIRLTLYPAIHYTDPDGKRHRYRVARVQTELLLQPGARVWFGGNDQAMHDFMRQLLGPELYRDYRTTDVVGFHVTATVHRPTPPPAAEPRPAQ